MNWKKSSVVTAHSADADCQNICNLYLGHQGHEGIEPLHKFSLVTSEKRTSSEELENARGSSERSSGREAKRGPDEGAELWHLMGMKYKMSDGGYDDINEESDDGPNWGRVNRVHEPVIFKDDMIFDGIKYDVIKEGDGGLDGWQVSEAHEPIVPKDMILELWNNEIKIVENPMIPQG